MGFCLGNGVLVCFVSESVVWLGFGSWDLGFGSWDLGFGSWDLGSVAGICGWLGSRTQILDLLGHTPTWYLLASISRRELATHTLDAKSPWLLCCLHIAI